MPRNPENPELPNSQNTPQTLPEEYRDELHSPSMQRYREIESISRKQDTLGDELDRQLGAGVLP